VGLPAVLDGRYAIAREIGRGGMATVYLARDLAEGTDVAVKVLSPDLAPLLGAERFAREIRITSTLCHPNILPVLDSGAADGHPYYVMPFVDGESLAQRLRREGQLPIEDALDLACQVAEALGAAHDDGFVHRDIKPSNILLSDGRALLADFGIARTIDTLTNEKLTESGVALGTASYMSPEQASGGRVDSRSDLYSLGCVLFEMLSGGPPFTGASSQSVRARHVVDPVPSIHTVRTTVTPSLERVIVKSMAKVPADRYADARHFIEAIRAVDLTETATATSPPRRIGRLLPIAAGLVALVVAVVAWRLIAGRGVRTDANRVMVFPLIVPAGYTGPRSIGEDVSTMIGNALDGAGALRWIDGWPLLGRAQRDDIRTLTVDRARALAISRRCGYYVTGRLVARGDSADVFLELKDVAGDSTVARGKASGPSTDAWRLGLRAVNTVLPALIPSGPPDVAAEWADRDPGAVASYLAGEAAFRRVHLSEALAHYRDAVKADTSFGLAAVRGAQAATWNHRSSEAASFIQTALRQKLSPRYSHFALGYAAYLEGRADSSAAELHRALAIDPEMTVAWMQLGEVYTHLLPGAGRVDSLASDAFETAHRLDPRATNLLLHLIESGLRRGDTAAVRPMVRDFLAANPDTSRLAHQVRVMDACVRRGPAGVDWTAESHRDRTAVISASKALAAGGAQLGCAMAAAKAVIADDTTQVGDDRWFALLILQAGLLAEGRTADAVDRVRARPPGDDAASMLLMDGAVYPEIASEASAVAASLAAKCGPDYRGCGSSSLIWKLAIWEAQAGRAALAERAARELTRRVADSAVLSPADRRLVRIQAASAAAHAALAAGDTTGALARFRSLIREPIPGGLEFEWDVARPRGLDRLVLARLLLATGDARGALETASVLDSSSPAVFLLYVPAGLRLRIDAATALGDVALANVYRARLAALATAVTPAIAAVPTPKGGVS
jgi:serine/threonine protein kinase/tetratricopeptide (TPR) repeat protein